MCISMTGAPASDLAAIATQFADPDAAGTEVGTERGGSVPAGSVPAGSVPAGD